MIDFLSGLDWSPLWISLKTGVVAAAISFFLGIFMARKVVRSGPKVRAVADRRRFFSAFDFFDETAVWKHAV